LRVHYMCSTYTRIWELILTLEDVRYSKKDFQRKYLDNDPKSISIETQSQ